MPDLNLSAYLKGNGKFCCNGLYLCEISGNIALTLGNGRRGQQIQSNFISFQKQNLIDFGLGIEGSVMYNICTEQIDLEGNFVFSIGIKIPYYQTFSLDVVYPINIDLKN